MKQVISIAISNVHHSSNLFTSCAIYSTMELSPIVRSAVFILKGTSSFLFIFVAILDSEVSLRFLLINKMVNILLFGYFSSFVESFWNLMGQDLFWMILWIMLLKELFSFRKSILSC